MCLSYPGRVIAIDETGAVVRGEHRDYRASTALVPDLSPGDFVIVGAGMILERLEPDDAAELRGLLDRASGPPPAADRAEGGASLIVGVGNDLRADDGVGRVVAERLAVDPRLVGCTVESLMQLAPELAPDVASASLVVFLDATVELPPGEVRVAPAGRADDARPLTHHMTPGALVALAESVYGASPDSFIVGIGVGSLDAAAPLSAAVEAAIPRAVDLVVDLVTSHRAAGATAH